MCGSMVDIQSATAEIRRGKKIERRKKKPQGKDIMSHLLRRTAIINFTVQKKIVNIYSIFMLYRLVKD